MCAMCHHGYFFVLYVIFYFPLPKAAAGQELTREHTRTQENAIVISKANQGFAGVDIVPFLPEKSASDIDAQIVVLYGSGLITALPAGAVPDL